MSNPSVDSAENTQNEQNVTIARARRKHKTKVSKEAFLKAVPGTGGLYTKIAKKLKIQRQTVARYIERYPDLKAAVEDEIESTIDTAEEAIKGKIAEGDTQAIMFFLKTKGKHRGYTEKTETELSGSVTMAPPPVICFGQSSSSPDGARETQDAECQDE